METIVFCRRAKQLYPKGPAGLNKEQTTEKKCKGRNILEKTPIFGHRSILCYLSPLTAVHFFVCFVSVGQLSVPFFVLFVEPIFLFWDLMDHVLLLNQHQQQLASNLIFTLLSLPALCPSFWKTSISTGSEWSGARIRTAGAQASTHPQWTIGKDILVEKTTQHLH